MTNQESLGLCHLHFYHLMIKSLFFLFVAPVVAFVAIRSQIITNADLEISITDNTEETSHL